MIGLPVRCGVDFSGRRLLFVFILSSIFFYSQGQQNNILFFMHAVPEANFLNPAVQNKCKWFIGLPFFSSNHLNIASNGFTFNQLLNQDDNDNYVIDMNFIEQKMAARNLISSELHTTWIALGWLREGAYFTFSAIEKNNALVIYTPELISLGINGNTAFEGQSVNLKETGTLVNHVREYALGVSWRYNDRIMWGVKAKLLFGKLNLVTPKMDIQLFTENNTFNLQFDADASVNASLPYTLEANNNNSYRRSDRYETSLSDFLMNPRNPGFAVDLGFVYVYNERLTLSGSLLDLGFIHYRSNLTNYTLEGSYTYPGPLSDSLFRDNRYYDVFDQLNANMNENLSHSNYFYFLNPQLYMGASVYLNDRTNFEILSYNRLLPGKIQSGIMTSLHINLFENTDASISWSYMHRSLRNLGLGIAVGKSPIQAYFISDNILGFIWQKDTKNVNLRFGINVNLQCEESANLEDCGCAWLLKAENRRLRKERLKRGN